MPLYIYNLTTTNPSTIPLPYTPIDLPDLPCEKCKSTINASQMLLCELCGKGFHSSCFPPCPKYVPFEFFYCNPCLTKITSFKKVDPILNFSLLTYLKFKTFPKSFNT